MWETEFEESMLSANPGVAILCPEEHLADELFELFKLNGTAKNWNFNGGTKWENNRENTVYCLSGERVLYGSKHSVERSRPYCNYIRCTFHGAESADFETAPDDELMTFLGITR